MPAYRTPADFAAYVRSYLLGRRKPADVPAAALTAIAEALFGASFLSEEGRPIRCHLSYLDSANPDLDPPERIVRDRWQAIPFADHIPLSTAAIVKLALASDTRTSSIAIYSDHKGRPYIWGLIDQANRSHAFSFFESDSGMERPGAFHISILGTGHLAASSAFLRIAELRGNRLVRASLPVFDRGPVRTFLQPHIDGFVARVRNKIPPEIYSERDHWDRSLAEDFLKTLVRLLNRIHAHGHGGAVLLAPPNAPHLRLKYAIEYRRLTQALEEGGISTILKTTASDHIFEEYSETPAELMPIDLYLEETVEANNAAESALELDGALWFVSLLSRVDGLVLMQPDLIVHGFGVEITCTHEPGQVFAARDANATQSKLVKQSYEHFGTRHRSMLRYCHLVPGTLGFVLSQDGSVRAITRVGERVVIWEDIQLQFEGFASVKSAVLQAKTAT